jgi:glutamate formiminotransferase
VPNFSEGRDTSKIEQITAEVEKVPGVKLLDVASDAYHNRTVLTFVGGPESIKKASYNAIARAAEIIDMAVHQGQHPRLGACDVCPFVPIQNVTMADCVTVANEPKSEKSCGSLFFFTGKQPDFQREKTWPALEPASTKAWRQN